MTAVTPARQVAYAVIRRVFEQGAYADRALHGEARGLDRRERGLAMRLAYGTIQRRLTLDHIIERLARPVDELDAPTLAALRLGLYQLAFLDHAAAHAIVGESVELAKGRKGGHALVNAVLRRALREGVPALPDDDTPQGAAIAHSYPPWLVELWWERFGPAETRALLRAGNEPGELALRVNTLVASPGDVAEQLGAATTPAGDELPEG
ncbi:MAG: 16S rRNA (cytosine(967)-C(5))-methyltransferase RsmB, partial [Actinomycetota bacterium]|nr:16S rRNA (cytosine(967)-C(5))-methyltransferase RsmB [Actinomycetota bacterium]